MVASYKSTTQDFRTDAARCQRTFCCKMACSRLLNLAYPYEYDLDVHTVALFHKSKMYCFPKVSMQ